MAARGSPKKGPQEDGKRGPTVGTVRKGKAAARSAGSGAGSDEEVGAYLAGIPSLPRREPWRAPWSEARQRKYDEIRRRLGVEYGFCSPEEHREIMRELDHQPPAGDAEISLPPRLQTGTDRGERKRPDHGTAGAEPAGGVSDACSGEAADEMRAVFSPSSGYWSRGMDGAEGLGIARPHAYIYAWGYDNGRDEQEREAARRSRAKACAALLVGIAIGAILLAVAQAIFGR